MAAGCITFGVLVGLPTLYLLLNNAVNIGVTGGFMATCGKSDQFFTLILPHGMLELTAVFIAGAVGLRLGWRVLVPGPRRRTEALAAEGRSAVVIALGLVLVLAVSGAVEAFVTPSYAAARRTADDRRGHRGGFPRLHRGAGKARLGRDAGDRRRRPGAGRRPRPRLVLTGAGYSRPFAFSAR